MNGKTIRIYLVDGNPTGVLTAEIINWTGKIIVAPRLQLAELAKREEVKRTGVYCLVGEDPDNPNREILYVGEGDSVLQRLISHDKDELKDFWTRCVVVISKDQNLTKAHGRYLESQIIRMAQHAGRCSISNGTAPPLPPLPESDTADMEFFLTQIQMVLPVVGFGFLQPKLAATPGKSPLFQLNIVNARATARQVGDQFVVLKGSTARKIELASWSSYRALRNKLIAEGKLVDSAEPDLYVFVEDVALSSPSAGAAVVNAGNMNGRSMWKVAETGESYQEWYDKKLPKPDGEEAC